MIFGIGLSKTGTTSLTEALKVLGYKTKHYIHSNDTLKRLHTGRFKLPELDGVDALSGNPAPIYYPQFDEVYPGSKFILTVRELSEWLDSCRAHFGLVTRINKRKIKPLGALDGPVLYRTAQYGCVKYHKSRWAWVYQRHVDTACRYFEARSDDFLVFNILHGWQNLCRFLDKDIPKVAFPHANKR